MGQHTPRPWTVHERDHVLEVCDGSDVLIADLTLGAAPNQPGTETAVANAHLISAAPELLDALLGLLATARSTRERPQAFEQAMLDGDNAVAKARGEP